MASPTVIVTEELRILLSTADVGTDCNRGDWRCVVGFFDAAGEVGEEVGWGVEARGGDWDVSSMT